MMAGMSTMLKWAREMHEQEAAGVVDLFSGRKPPPSLPDLPEFTLNEKLWYERKSTGGFLSGHPVDSYREAQAHRVTHDVAALDALLDSGCHGGIVVCTMIVTVYFNSFSTNLLIEDASGRYEVSVQKEDSDRYRHLLEKDMIVLLRLSIYHGASRSKFDVLKMRRLGKFTLKDERQTSDE